VGGIPDPASGHGALEIPQHVFKYAPRPAVTYVDGGVRDTVAQDFEYPK
jgi:hypothetical protein